MGFVVFEKGRKMKINYELDQDGCLDVELIENSVDWHKEEGGDNILLQYINGGESMRIIERFPEDVNIVEAHHHGKSLIVKFSDGDARGYYQDKMGNYKLLKDLKNNNVRDKGYDENRQKEAIAKPSEYKKNSLNIATLRSFNNRTY